MGFFDKVKNKINNAVQQPQQPQQVYQSQEPADDTVDDDDGDEQVSSGAYDTAGFDWDNDEDSYFEAQIAIESEGMTLTSLTKDEAYARFGLRDHLHWQDVKAAVWHCLAQKYGSHEVVMQRQMNFQQGLMLRHQQQQVANMTKGGGFEPVEGITLEKWAAINAAIVSGASHEDLLKGNGISQARWDKARVEWEARMARDTTFAIATIYGQAFQAASTGKYSANVKEANAARAANRDMSMPPPITVRQYFDVLYEQSYAPEPVAALKGMGLTITDWVDLGTIMGYHIHRTWAHHIKQYQADMAAAEQQAKGRYPNAHGRDVDIQF